MKGKRILYSEPAYFVGIFVLALGTALMEKADFGMSMVVAPAYLLHLKISEYLRIFHANSLFFKEKDRNCDVTITVFSDSVCIRPFIGPGRQPLSKSHGQRSAWIAGEAPAYPPG